MKIIFFGSSQFSIPALKACMDSPHEVSLVITTPDRKRGRGLKLFPTVVKEVANEMNLPVLSPESLKDEMLIKQIKDLKPELYVVSSYGKFIPSTWLKIPSKYSLNVHPSLLPKYRGAAPINWPIINGDKETGVSIMEVTKELDAGDVFYQYRCELNQQINADELGEKLAEKSYEVLTKVLNQVGKSELPRSPQDSNLSCYARKLTKHDGVINWTHNADELHNQIRGLLPWPAAYTFFEGEPLQILKSTLFSDEGNWKGTPGEILRIDKGGKILIATGTQPLWIDTVKPSGKKAMTASDFINGKRLKPGFVFESKPDSSITQSS